MSTNDPSDRDASDKKSTGNTRSSLIGILILLALGITVALMLLLWTNIQNRINQLGIEVEAVSTNVPEIDARVLLAEVNDLKEQLDSGINSFNSLIDWTQFVGIAVAVVAGVAAIVGLRIEN